MHERFGGVWVLDPTTCAYGGQPVPRSGISTVILDGAEVHAEIRWVDHEGTPGVARYAAVVGGPPQQLGDAGSLSMQLEGDALVTELVVDGEVVHRASRSVDVGRTAMTIVQRDATGETTGVYRRASVKQVICYRRDLKMRKGKIAAQVAHASMRVFFGARRSRGFELAIGLPGPTAWWVRHRFTKVVLSVESEAELLRIAELAKEAGIPNAIITDAGRTEFGGVPTRTTVAVGPWVAEVIDAITGPDGEVPTKLA